MHRRSGVRRAGVCCASVARPVLGPELVRETLRRCWGMLVGMPDNDQTEPGAPRTDTAALFTEDEAIERVRTALEQGNVPFRRALFTMLNDETPRERDDARKVALLELIAVELNAPAPPTDVPAPAMPGTTFAQRAPTFR